ncbi:MAG: methionine synthase [Armatimonadota bacterium]|nr:methionine synthase [Armatimonadota bacterium]MDR7486418.1 methionine synthase [Armatimonadota bacterium]MDR7532551.1 methionine synthase [Armatimonadota bacterium]MDR7535560.1 methionine synthase [Armatimonadota bacterium]
MGAPYRADHVGSFLRPPELLEARAQGADREHLRELEDRHILRVLVRQQELGFEVFTDGEFRRRNFMSDLVEAVEGFDLHDEIGRPWKGTGTAVAPASVTGIVTAKLRQVRRMTAHEVAFMRAHCPGAIKITLPSANQFPAIAFKRGVTDRVYPDHSALLWDIVPVVQAEIQALLADGVHYIQVDAPRYSYYVDPRWRAYIRNEVGMEPEAALEEAIRADNTCLEGARGRGAVIGFHLCRGNNRSQWYAEGGYDAIAERLFGGLQVDRFLLEYDDERSGTFEPLRFVPADKTVVLGLVSTKRPQLESKATLLRRIEEAARYVPLDRLAMSPQCGFASVMEGNLLSEDDQWAKLRLVVETAREVWG